MKILLTILATLLTFLQYGNAQELLRDGDFEVMTVFDVGLAKADNLTYWERLTGSPDIYELNIYGFDEVGAYSEDLYISFLGCESLYQKLKSPLLPNKSYTLSFYVQTRPRSNFLTPEEVCGKITVFGASEDVLGTVANNGCPSEASVRFVEYFEMPEMEEDWSPLFWCFSPQDTIHYLGFGVEMEEECNLWLLMDDAQLSEVKVGDEIFADLFPDTLNICAEENPCAEVSVNAAFDFSWEDGTEGGNRSLCGADTYEVTYQGGGCPLKEKIVVRNQCAPHTIVLSNAFSPNDDGINDHWRVLLDKEALKNLVEAELLIFDRFGNLLLQRDKNDLQWDGFVKGRLQPMGMYVYVLTYHIEGNPKQFLEKGTITLVK